MSTPRPRVEVTRRVDGYRRLDDGVPIRSAMADRGLTITGLAERTRELDQAGDGVNWRTIGFLVSQGKSARETCTESTAQLVASALAVPIDRLFEARVTEVVRVAGVSAHSRIEVDAS